MNLLILLFIVAIFFVLTPGILVSLPPGGSKMVVALTHAVVFALVFYLTYIMARGKLHEGFKYKYKPMKSVTKSNNLGWGFHF